MAEKARNPVFAPAFDLLDEAIAKFREFNDHPSFRCRELSLAITEMETGRLWAKEALGKYDGEEE